MSQEAAGPFIERNVSLGTHRGELAVVLQEGTAGSHIQDGGSGDLQQQEELVVGRQRWTPDTGNKHIFKSQRLQYLKKKINLKFIFDRLPPAHFLLQAGNITYLQVGGVSSPAPLL